MAVRRGHGTRPDVDYRKALPRVAKAGFDFAELLMEGPHRPERIHREAGEINALASTEGVELVLQFPVGLGLGSPHEPVREGARKAYEAAIEAAAAAGAEKGILRAETTAFRPAYDDEPLRREFVEALLDLDSYAAHAGLELCVENAAGLLTLREGFPQLFEEGVRVCLNTAAARQAGLNPTQTAALLVERNDAISHVHLPDRSRTTGGETDRRSAATDPERPLSLAGDLWSGTAATVAFDGARIDRKPTR